MPLPKLVAAGISAAVLGAQLWVSFPISKELRAWYWPFLPYPMYATAHGRDDFIVQPQLRVAVCGLSHYEKVLTAADVGVSTEQLKLALVYIAEAPHAPRANRASKMLSGAIEAQHPGRYCSASSWIRVVSVLDTSTHHVDATTRMASEWSLLEAHTK